MTPFGAQFDGDSRVDARNGAMNPRSLKFDTRPIANGAAESSPQSGFAEKATWPPQAHTMSHQSPTIAGREPRVRLRHFPCLPLVSRAIRRRPAC